MAQYRPLPSRQNVQGKPRVSLLRKERCSRGPERSILVPGQAVDGAELQAYQQQRPPNVPGHRSFINLSSKREGNKARVFCDRSRELGLTVRLSCIYPSLLSNAASAGTQITEWASVSCISKCTDSCHSTDPFQVLCHSLWSCPVSRGMESWAGGAGKGGTGS